MMRGALGRLVTFEDPKQLRGKDCSAVEGCVAQSVPWSAAGSLKAWG